MQEGGGGFRDFSRIAGSSAEMWVDIFQENRREILSQLDGFQASLDAMRTALQRGDRAALAAMLEQAATFRQGWVGR
jgi:prephenate dehydrogenase